MPQSQEASPSSECRIASNTHRSLRRAMVAGGADCNDRAIAPAPVQPARAVDYTRRANQRTRRREELEKGRRRDPAHRRTAAFVEALQ